MSEPDRLTDDERFVLCWWSVQALAEELLISTDTATELLEAAYAQGRVEILGNGYFAGRRRGPRPDHPGDPRVADPPGDETPARRVARCIA